jgi:hypothetical protein
MKYLGSYISPELGTWLQTAAAVFAPREAVAEETPEAATAQWEHLLARHDSLAEPFFRAARIAVQRRGTSGALRVDHHGSGISKPTGSRARHPMAHEVLFAVSRPRRGLFTHATVSVRGAWVVGRARQLREAGSLGGRPCAAAPRSGELGWSAVRGSSAKRGAWWLRRLREEATMPVPLYGVSPKSGG